MHENGKNNVFANVLICVSQRGTGAWDSFRLAIE